MTGGVKRALQVEALEDHRAAVDAEAGDRAAVAGLQDDGVLGRRVDGGAQAIEHRCRRVARAHHEPPERAHTARR